ncbi:MAG: DinB family protein [Gemmatimonadaceae bacterium]|nr:DinB family protein [Gemmatimonadaceae bacterium]
MNQLSVLAPQGRFILGQSRRWLADLNDSHLALEPLAGLKTAGWLVGHLAVTGDFGRRICGLSTICPKEWRTHFNPGTFPSPDPATYPPMAELRDAMLNVYRGLFAEAPSAPDEVLSRPNPYVPAQPFIPTAGEFAAYLMTGHLAHHLGQLSSWHAAAGLRRTGERGED